jgi:hypothetical protein
MVEKTGLAAATKSRAASGKPVPAGHGSQGQELPEKLVADIEKMSGADLRDVRVHYNSAMPARLGAQAYTDGNDIHLAPGQGHQVAHEAWHIVQQKGGRVSATGRSHIGLGVRDDAGLEREADVLGDKATDVARDLLAKRTPV